MSQKVSVVVPVYKVEKYINRCVDSILNQTYKNLQVILVDDGSPDNCGRIIDYYAGKDSRVIAVHKKNGGLSDARNCGMQYVTGQFTMFVDSDDWLEGEMIESMVSTSLKMDAEIIQTAFYYAYDDCLYFDDRFFKEDMEPVVLDNKALMKELVINERVKNFAWGKLYRTSLIKDLPFKKGVLFEDVFWTHRVMQRVNRYVIMHKPMYYYYQRKDSIASTYTLKNLDILKGLMERHLFLQEYYPELTDESLKMILKTCLIHYNLLVIHRKKDKDKRCRKEIASYIKNNYGKLYMAVRDDKRLARQLQLFDISPFLNILYLAAGKILRKLKILPQPAGLRYMEYKQG